ncbi:MAG TPA: hypothetical protein VKX39_12025 [Bryobacteraceae bacterium]|nr:hypothetical protein [Bryobacteraceae bacterium]
MTSFEQARCWFARSGIQETSGGVARYYRSDQCRNAAVSNEITGYAASSFVYFGDLDAARRAAAYLRDCAWSAPSSTFPFEPGSPLAYFFDVGIMARGLFAAARATGDASFRDRAREAALSLAFDFLGDGAFHPVIELPAKQPLAYERRWSRSPGCYQLKAALAWREAGDEQAARLFEAALAQSLAMHQSFLDCEPDREKLMDRLHAYCYFLEGLLAAADRPEPRAVLESGIARVAALWREISPQFERSDVCAQLLRLRLIAHRACDLALDESAAREEAERVASYQSFDSDPRLHGGFWFGKKGGALLPFMNPVSTAFAAQALALWEQHSSGRWNFSVEQLI